MGLNFYDYDGLQQKMTHTKHSWRGVYIFIILEPWMINLWLGYSPDNHQNCQPNLRQKSTLDAKMTEARMNTRYRPRFSDRVGHINRGPLKVGKLIPYGVIRGCLHFPVFLTLSLMCLSLLIDSFFTR